MKSFYLLLLPILLCSQSNNKVFYLGHSLINFEIPNMVSKLAAASNSLHQYQAHIGNGANLSWHWTNPRTAQGNIWDTTLRNQTFDHFILTEAIALKSHLKWSNTYGYLDSFYNYAVRKSPKIKLYIYETWHCINSGTPTGCMYDDDKHIPWRTRLTDDLKLWEGIADHLNKRVPNSALMIPGGQGLAKLFDTIPSGVLPGFNSHRQLFTDDIHLTNIGNYFIACIMYSVIFKKSPSGLPNRLTTFYNVPYDIFPTPGQAAVLQKIAWETACKYARTNLNCSTTGISEENKEHKSSLEYYPNPSHDRIIFSDLDEDILIEIISIDGKKIHQKRTIDKTIDVSKLESGIYFLRHKNLVTKLTKY